jgi:hypothetical protein
MIGGKSPDGLGLDTTASRAAGRRQAKRVSIRFRRGAVVAIIAAVLLWAGLIAAWRLL